MIYLVIRASGRPRDPLQNRRRAQPEAQHGYVLLGPRKVKKQKTSTLAGGNSPVSSRTESEQVWDLGVGAAVGGR